MTDRAMLEAAPWLVAGLAGDGRIVHLNPAGRALLGGTAAGAHFADALDPRHRDRFARAYARWRLRPRGARLVARLATARDLEVVIVPGGGEDAAWVFGADVTERRQGQAALRDSEARYRGFFEHVPVGLYRTSVDGALVDANPAMVELTGFPDLDTLIRTPIDTSYVDLEDRLRWREAMQRDGVVRGFENRNRRWDGSEFWVRDSGRVIRNAAGEPLYYQGTLEDITEQKRAEERLRASEAQLLQAQKMGTIGQLAGEIAHDFNNLLTVIQGNLSFGLEAELDPELRRDLEEIRFAADRAAALTRKLLAFSRSQQAQPVVFEPGRVAAELGALLRRVLGIGVELGVEIDPDAGYVLADPGQLEQVLMNLALNARDAMPEGGLLRIGVDRAEFTRTAQAGSGPFVRISVVDSGHGMDADTQARIFEPFFTTKAAGSGTGLGLSTVFGIVRESGGALEVESAPGAGTTFRVYLPAVDPGRTHPDRLS